MPTMTVTDKPITLHGVCQACLARVEPGFDPRYGVRYCTHTKVLLLDAQMVGLGWLGPLISIYPVDPGEYRKLVEQARDVALNGVLSGNETLQ